MLQKIYGSVQDTPETRYSPAICMGAREAVNQWPSRSQPRFDQLR